MTRDECNLRGVHILHAKERLNNALSATRMALVSAHGAQANPRFIGALRRAESDLKIAIKENERLASRMARKIEQHQEMSK